MTNVSIKVYLNGLTSTNYYLYMVFTIACARIQSVSRSIIFLMVVNIYIKNKMEPHMTLSILSKNPWYWLFFVKKKKKVLCYNRCASFVIITNSFFIFISISIINWFIIMGYIAFTVFCFCLFALSLFLNKVKKKDLWCFKMFLF
jgi:hypothetical protein